MSRPWKTRWTKGEAVLSFNLDAPARVRGELRGDVAGGVRWVTWMADDPEGDAARTAGGGWQGEHGRMLQGCIQDSHRPVVKVIARNLNFVCLHSDVIACIRGNPDRCGTYPVVPKRFPNPCACERKTACAPCRLCFSLRLKRLKTSRAAWPAVLRTSCPSQCVWRGLPRFSKPSVRLPAMRRQPALPPLRRGARRTARRRRPPSRRMHR